MIIPGYLPLLRRTQISGLNIEGAGALLQFLLNLGDPYLSIHYGSVRGLLCFLCAYRRRRFLELFFYSLRFLHVVRLEVQYRCREGILFDH